MAEYLTAANFRLARDIASYADNTYITLLIERAQAAIDNYTRTTFGATASVRYFDSIADVEGQTLWTYNEGPLASITTVTNGDASVIAGSSYVTEPRNAVAQGKPIRGIRLKTSSVAWKSATGSISENAIAINGVWAYSATVPADITQATEMIAGWLYDHRMSQDGDLILIPGSTVRIPRGMWQGVREILDQYIWGVL